MRLAEFIDREREKILDESIAYASQIPALQDANEQSLRDHLPLVLEAIARDLQQPQSRQESVDKSRGEAPAPAAETAAQSHGTDRALRGLDVEQLVAEFRVLRSSILRLWAESEEPDCHALEDMVRFNEAVDQAVAESVAFFAAEIDRWRSIFLGVLGHDLRGPLNAVLLTADLLAREDNARVAKLSNALLRNGRRLATLLDSLLEYNRMTLACAEVDLGLQCHEEIEILRSTFPERKIELNISGDTRGNFDSSRIREALANLVSNAVQHSPADTQVEVAVVGGDANIAISTVNAAGAIPADVMATLFEPLQRHHSDAESPNGHLGLGLFIVREISHAHHGEVAVTEVPGRICFEMMLPKKSPAC
jgi:signal transduction histidine kinase